MPIQGDVTIHIEKQCNAIQGNVTIYLVLGQCKWFRRTYIFKWGLSHRSYKIITFSHLTNDHINNYTTKLKHRVGGHNNKLCLSYRVIRINYGINKSIW